MKLNKKDRWYISAIILIVVYLLSFFIINQGFVTEIRIIEIDFLLTYLGLFIGFAITIYTFGISILENIKNSIIESEQITEDKRQKFLNSILNGFVELKQDILVITISFIVVIVLSFVSKLFICIGDLKLTIYEFYSSIIDPVYLSIFIISIITLLDLLFSLFNVSEIYLHLFKQVKK